MGEPDNRFYALDAARFAAAFGVVLYHLTARPGGSFDQLSAITKFGYLGVPAFFIISGLVIAMSATGRSAYQFAVSRFARLYPALWGGILLTLLVLYFAAGEAFAPARVVANFALLNDYVGQPDIDGVYWTLHAELKFYACVFLLVAVGAFSRYHVWLSAWLGLSVFHHFTGQPGFMGWLISPNWSPFFIIGVAIYHISAFRPGLFNLSVLAGAVVLGAVKSYSFAGDFMAPPSASEALVAAASIPVFAAIMLAVATGRISMRSSPWVMTAGAMTYPLYLIHNKAGKALIDGPLAGLGESIAVAITVVLALLAAYCLHRYFEVPVSKWFRSFGFALPGRLKSRAAAALVTSAD